MRRLPRPCLAASRLSPLLRGLPSWSWKEPGFSVCRTPYGLRTGGCLGISGETWWQFEAQSNFRDWWRVRELYL